MDTLTTNNANTAGLILDGVVGYPADAQGQYREAGFWKDQTISQALAATAQRDPAAVALVTPECAWTYGELVQVCDNIAAGLLTTGLEPGERVLLQLTNSAWAVAAWYGILRAGLVPVCTLAIHREHEIGQIGRKTAASAHLVQEDFGGYDLIGLAASMRSEIPTLRMLLTIGEAAGGANRPDGAVRVEDLAQRPASEPELERLDEIQANIDLAAPAALQLSGGTTGTPKVIPRLHPEYWYNGLVSAGWWGLGPGDRLAFGLPIAHNAGVANALFGAHATGATLLLAGPQPDQLLPLMADYGATWLMSPPGVMRDYLDDPRFAEAFKSVATCVLTAAPVPRPLFDEIQGRGVRVAQAFGMTEGLFLFTPVDSSDELRATTVGIPISPLDEVRLLAPGTDEPVADGEVGELCVRGPYTIRGYLDEPERNAEAFTADGFYRAGDLSTIVTIGSETGYALAGRTKDLINRGGEKINAEEVESLLIRHPAVAEAALVALPDPRLGERACAFIVIHEGAKEPTVADFQQFLAGLGVAKFKWPERVVVIPSMPRTNIGKVQKVKLREIVARESH